MADFMDNSSNDSFLPFSSTNKQFSMRIVLTAWLTVIKLKFNAFCILMRKKQ